MSEKDVLLTLMDVLVLHARPYKRRGIPGVMAPNPGSKNDESLVQGSWFKDGLDDSVGKLNKETQMTCMPDCKSCQDGLFSNCQENTDNKFDYRGNIPLSKLDNQPLDLSDFHSEVNKLKGEDFGTRSLSIIH